MNFLQLIIRLAIFFGKIRRKFLLAKQGVSLEEIYLNGLNCLLAGKKLAAFDIGGAVGLQPHWEKMKGSSDFYIFEPHPKSFAELKAQYSTQKFGSSFHVFPFALGGKSEQRKIYLTNAPTGSSLNPVNTNSRYISKDNDYFFPVKEETINTKCLRDFLFEEKIPSVDMIKLDVQSAEQEILEGLGKENISKLLSVELEVPMHEFYLNGTTVDGIWHFFRENDLEVYDVRVARAHINTSANSKIESVVFTKDWDPSIAARAWEMEMIAFKNPMVLMAKKDFLSLRKLASAMCVYNFFNEAIEIFSMLQSSGELSKNEFDNVQEQIIAMQKAISIETANYKNLMLAGDRRNWSQYMWMTLPSN